MLVKELKVRSFHFFPWEMGGKGYKINPTFDNLCVM